MRASYWRRTNTKSNAKWALTVIEMNALQQDESHAWSRTLVVPPGTRRFVVIGTPGVGKSRSLNYLIREIILEPPKKKPQRRQKPARRRPLFLNTATMGWCGSFVAQEARGILCRPTRPTSNVEGSFWSQSNSRSLQSSKLFTLSTLGEAERSEMPALVAATTIFPCSPDARYFSEFQKHMRGNPVFCPVLAETRERFSPLFPMFSSGNKASAKCSARRMPRSSCEHRESSHRRRRSDPSACVFCRPPISKFAEFKRQLDTTLKRCEAEIADILRYGVGLPHGRDRTAGANLFEFCLCDQH